MPADKRWQERSYDRGEVLERARRDGLNLGVRLPADVVVVDVDPRNFPAGRDSLAELAAAFGLPLASAPHVLTGNLEHPGHHFYFRKPAGAVLLDTVDGFEGVEFKSLGRQVVAAGSVHPTGGLYRWASDSPPLPDMPDLPARLVEAARRPERKRAAGAGEITAEQLAASLEYLDPTDFREHDRWLELMMACHHATDGDGEARQEFIAWSTSDPSYADHEWIVGRRWDSLHADRDDAVTIATLRRRLNEVGSDIAPPDAAEDFDVWDEVEPIEPRARRRFLNVNDLKALPPPRWLVPGLLVEDSVAAIYGAPESGKSFLALDIAMAVAGGVDWHGRRVTDGGVLYVAAEGASGLGKRVRAWEIDRGIDVGKFPLWLDHGEINLAAERDGGVRAFVSDVVEELGPLRLVVIDTLNQTAAGADENSAKDMGRYIASMKRIRDETGATVVVVHHSGKDPGKGMRGSSSLLGAMDTTVEVSRDKEVRAITVTVHKQKDAEREPPMRFNLERVDLPGEPDWNGRPPSSLVLRPTVMVDAASDFGGEATTDDGLTALACELGASGGTVKASELLDAATKRLGMSKSSAQRAVTERIPEGRIDAVRASWDGRHFWLWCERVGKHSTAPKVVRVEAAP
ncbi:AAA family ATPase [Pseudoxanthomonas mexicana]|uniref:AAA family ATPase n=1 Tax=Pseudoxanthomonas mexicana TaxID=128785 RepID=UPI00398B1443